MLSSLQLANTGGNLGASAMDNLMLAMASNAQTIQALVGNRQASRCGITRAHPPTWSRGWHGKGYSRLMEF